MFRDTLTALHKKRRSHNLSFQDLEPLLSNHRSAPSEPPGRLDVLGPLSSLCACQAHPLSMGPSVLYWTSKTSTSAFVVPCCGTATKKRLISGTSRAVLPRGPVGTLPSDL